jgi:hypothetical protein
MTHTIVQLLKPRRHNDILFKVCGAMLTIRLVELGEAIKNIARIQLRIIASLHIIDIYVPVTEKRRRPRNKLRHFINSNSARRQGASLFTLATLNVPRPG